MKWDDFFDQGEDGPTRQFAWLCHPLYDFGRLLMKLGIAKEDQP